MSSRNITRRRFITHSGAVAAGLSLASARVKGAPAAGANERIVLGMIGTGGQGQYHLRQLAEMKDVSVAAICDVDTSRREASGKAAGSSPRLFNDFRELLDDKSIDAVLIATPDHWHALATIQALEAGKHVYFEKPAAHNVREGRAMADAARKAKRVALMGVQQRSGKHWIEAVQRIKAGEIGKIESVHAWNAWNRKELFGEINVVPDSEPPPGVDYDRWLGPAPKRPFNPARFHIMWYFFWDYSGGMVSGWGVHLFDVVHWALGPDIRSVSAIGGHYVFKDTRDTPDTASAIFDCPGFTLTYTLRHGNAWRPHGDMDHGIEFFGTDGTLQINRNGFEMYHDKDRTSRKPYHTQKVAEDGCLEHKRHFFDCIRNGTAPRCDAQTGHLSSAFGHLANISYRVGRTVKWDAKAETIPNDPEASLLLARDYRPPWKLA